MNIDGADSYALGQDSSTYLPGQYPGPAGLWERIIHYLAGPWPEGGWTPEELESIKATTDPMGVSWWERVYWRMEKGIDALSKDQRDALRKLAEDIYSGLKGVGYGIGVLLVLVTIVNLTKR